MDVDGVQRSLQVASIRELGAVWTENLLGAIPEPEMDGVAAVGMVTGWPGTDKGYR